MPGPDPHRLIAAYAVDALSAEERAAVEEHLVGCVTCADELAALRAAEVALGDEVAVPPPAALRRRVLEEIGRTPQEPPAERPR